MSVGAFISEGLGVVYTMSWGLSFYPQAILNYRRRSVTGLSIDFLYLNPVGFACYTASNSALFWSTFVRSEYAARNNGNLPQVRWNDLVFAIHALVLSSFILAQSLVYARDVRQRSSTYTRLFIGVAILVIITAIVFAAMEVLSAGSARFNWLDVVYLLSYVKLFISFSKYVPQAVLNYQRKSTVGWSIENILLDFTGGVLSLGQLVLDSWLADDWDGITGNPGKLGLGILSVAFDVVFLVQHYVLYGGATLSLLGDVEAVERTPGERQPLLA